MVCNEGVAKVPPTLWRVKNFSKWDRYFLSIFTLLLGKEEDVVVYEGLVAIMGIYNRNPTPYSRYAQAITIVIRKQLTNFYMDRVFKYPSYLVYMFIFY